MPSVTRSTPSGPTASTPAPRTTGDTDTTTRSAAPARRTEVITRPPPSTSTDTTPSERSSPSTSSIARPAGPPPTSCTITPRAASSRRRAGSAPPRHSSRVAASSESIFAVSPVRRDEARTPRTGEAPGTIRTICWGASRRGPPARGAAADLVFQRPPHGEPAGACRVGAGPAQQQGRGVVEEPLGGQRPPQGRGEHHPHRRGAGNHAAGQLGIVLQHGARP